MAVPKKRMSKSKSNHRKALWKKKSFKKVTQCFLNLKKTSIQKNASGPEGALERL